jgi:hypothetical protein
MNTAEYLRDIVIPGANALLPEKLLNPKADFLLLAISWQESRMLYRKQIGRKPNTFGPAHGLWQFERIGVKDILERPVTKPILLPILKTLNYDFNIDTSYQAIVHNDVLAAVYARLTLWLDPAPLPNMTDSHGGWAYYLRGWRPGEPKPATWSIAFSTAEEITDGRRTHNV